MAPRTQDKGKDATMKWEFLGAQELWDSGVPGKGYAYKPLLWRTPVPGGWLLMTVNSKSNTPDPVISFYPDGFHSWTGRPDPQSEILLRPASAGALPADDSLLIGSFAPDDDE